MQAELMDPLTLKEYEAKREKCKTEARRKSRDMDQMTEYYSHFDNCMKKQPVTTVRTEQEPVQVQPTPQKKETSPNNNKVCIPFVCPAGFWAMGALAQKNSKSSGIAISNLFDAMVSMMSTTDNMTDTHNNKYVTAKTDNMVGLVTSKGTQV